MIGNVQILPEVVQRFMASMSSGDWAGVAATYGDAPRSFAFFDDDLQTILAWRDAVYVASDAIGIAQYAAVMRAHLSPFSSEVLSSGRAGNAAYAVFRWNARVRSTSDVITIISHCVWYLSEDSSKILDGVVTNRRIANVASARNH